MRKVWTDSPTETVLTIDGTEHNHIAAVMRMRVGDEITAISGDEFDRLYKITAITKKATTLRFISKSRNTRNPDRDFTVYMSGIKNDGLAIAVQKLNEIGVTDLKLFSSKYTAVSAESLNVPRLNEIARQSCKQCGRSLPMRVSYIKDFLSEIARRDKNSVLFCDTELSDKTNPSGVIEAIVIGSEGGFSEDERGALSKITTPVSLGNRILRAETAAIVGAGRWCI